MNVEEARAYCLNKINVTESTPFDDTTLVYKVENKMFALLSLEEDKSINLKCDPELSEDLRARYDFVRPGYHMNKKHWNTVEFTRCPDAMLHELIDHSYRLILKSLPKKIQANYAHILD